MAQQRDGLHSGKSLHNDIAIKSFNKTTVKLETMEIFDFRYLHREKNRSHYSDFSIMLLNSRPIESNLIHIELVPPIKYCI